MNDKKSKTILIVDDTPDNIDVLSNILKSDYNVKAAISGEIAIKITRSDKPPDLILLDVLMPGMNGFEVCRHLKADNQTKGIPVIFATANINNESKNKGIDAGGADFIEKPFNPDKILLTISRFL